MSRRFLSLAVLPALVCVTGLVATAPPAHAHAAVSATEPRAGSTVAELPRRLVIHVIKKQATRAGDPIQVFGPDGTRVDTGDIVVSDAGTVISVGLQPGVSAPGTYEVLYQITSADTHIIEDRFSFAVSPPPSAVLGAAEGPRSGGVASRAATPNQLRVIGPPAASVVAGAILLLAFVALALMLRRRHHRLYQPPRSEPFRVVSSGEHRLGPIPAPGRPPAGPAGPGSYRATSVY